MCNSIEHASGCLHFQRAVRPRECIQGSIILVVALDIFVVNEVNILVVNVVVSLKFGVLTTIYYKVIMSLFINLFIFFCIPSLAKTERENHILPSVPGVEIFSKGLEDFCWSLLE